MFSLIFRSFIFLFVITSYTISVWNIIDSYFRDEFKTYLKEVFNENEYTKPYYIDNKKCVTLNNKSNHYRICRDELQDYIVNLFSYTSYIPCDIK